MKGHDSRETTFQKQLIEQKNVDKLRMIVTQIEQARNFQMKNIFTANPTNREYRTDYLCNL